MAGPELPRAAEPPIVAGDQYVHAHVCVRAHTHTAMPSSTPPVIAAPGWLSLPLHVANAVQVSVNGYDTHERKQECLWVATQPGGVHVAWAGVGCARGHVSPVLGNSNLSLRC